MISTNSTPEIQFPDGLDTATFLQQYWQKQPLYMPQALPEFSNPLPPEELAGLAMEAGIPSRIVEQHSDHKWSVRQGPFSQADFAALDGKRWSLLITDVEKHLPEFMQYVQPFRFIPDWRFDDFMISYAPEGGSVGPHMDDYDTFLIQAQGVRNWKLEGQFRDLPQAAESLIEETDLRLIKQFNTEAEYECQVGDILYLPPRLGHYGVAQTDCMTWSMGFKAPSFQEMLLDYAEEFETLNEHKRYVDPNLSLQQNTGEITPLQIKQLKNWFLAQINNDDETFTRWIAKFLSRDYSGEAMLGASENYLDNTHLNQAIWVEANPFLRFHFTQLKGQVYLAVAGEDFLLNLALAKQLTAKAKVKLVLKTEQDLRVVGALLEKGFLLELDNPD